MDMNTPRFLFSSAEIASFLVACLCLIICLSFVRAARREKNQSVRWWFRVGVLFVIVFSFVTSLEIWSVWQSHVVSQVLANFFVFAVTVVVIIALKSRLYPLNLSPVVGVEGYDGLARVKFKVPRKQRAAFSGNRRSAIPLPGSKYTSMFETINDAIIGRNLNGDISYWNRAAEALFGYSGAEAVGQSIDFLLPEEQKFEFRRTMNLVQRGESVAASDTVRLHKNGTLIDISMMISPIRNDWGEIVGTTSLARDIRARKGVELRLKASEARKAAILNASLDAIITITHSGEVVEWNYSAERIFGRKREEVIGRMLGELIVPKRLRSAHEYGLARFLRTRVGEILGSRIEVPALRPDGSEFPIELSITAIIDENQVPLFTASARDISNRVKVEDVLKKSSERLQRIIESAPNGLLMIDTNGIIVLSNALVEELLGYAPAELVDRAVAILVPERFRGDPDMCSDKEIALNMFRQIEKGRDFCALRKDGEEIPVEIGLNPLELEEGAFTLASIMDVRKRKAMEIRIRQSAEAIRQRNREMEQLVSTVSHDLRSPLVTSTGFLGLLKDDLAAGRTDEMMETLIRLENSNQRMTQLIDDLLDLSRIGNLALKFEAVDVNEMIASIRDNISSQIQERNAVLLCQNGMPKINGDRMRMYQVFENLVINALKYGCVGENREILIGFRNQPTETHFFVRDQGPGIPAEHHKDIFKLFHRIHADNRGTGVGLAIVERVMHLHGGRVWVESAEESGAAFWLAFPHRYAPFEHSATE